MRRLLLTTASAGVLGLVASPAAADTSADIQNVRVDAAGHVSMTVTAPALAVGAGLDASSATLFVDGHAMKTRAVATQTHRVAGPAPTAMLVVDTSGSMSGAGIVAARKAARGFIAAAPPDVRIGLEAFSSEPRLVVPPTTQRSSVLNALPDLRPHGETALYDALKAAAFAAGGSTERLVVISDGADTVSHATLNAVVRRLGTRHVVAEVIALHTAESDNSALRHVAGRTGGRFVLAGDGDELAAALRSSARSYATELRLTATVPTALWGTDRELSVQVDSTAGLVTGTMSVTIGAVQASVDVGQPATRPASKRLLWEGLLAIAVALGLGLIGLFGGDGGAKRRARRLVSRYSTNPEPARERKLEVASISRAALRAADKVARSRELHERLTLRLTRAGVSLTPSEWLLLQGGIAFATVLMFTLFGMPPIVAVVAGVIVGPLLGHLYLGIRASKRRAAFISALPDTLQLIAGSLSAGYSLAQSLDGVVAQGVQPISGEFGRALAESRLGVPIERTLDHVAERMDSEDFRWVVLAIQIQHQVGGNLAEVLLTVAQTMRERVQLHRHVRALSAEGRLSAYILIGLPVFFSLYLFTLRREYLHPLYTSKLGIVMIGFACILLAIGTVVMNKMVKVEA